MHTHFLFVREVVDGLQPQPCRTYSALADTAFLSTPGGACDNIVIWREVVMVQREEEWSEAGVKPRPRKFVAVGIISRGHGLK